MARTGQYILDGAWVIAQDAGKPEHGFMLGDTPGIRWSEEEGLRWINDTQIDIVGLLPRANAKRALCTVAAGTRQTSAALGLADLIAFVDIPRNFSVSDEPGSPVTKRQRAWFDEVRPQWHGETGEEAEHWIANDEEPKAIHIWPAITGAAGKIEVIYSAVPADLADLTDPIGLDDIYATALMYGVLAKFYMKDATYGKNPQVAMAFSAAMERSLGLRGASITALDAGATRKSAGA